MLRRTHSSEVSLPPAPRRSHLVAIGALGALLIGGAWLAAPRLGRSAGGGPKLAWTAGGRTLDLLDTVKRNSELELRVELEEATYLYVGAWVTGSGLVALFPSQYLDCPHRNPLRAGEHRLPGSARGRTLRWPVGPDAGSWTILAVASPTPLAEVEAQLGRVRQMGNMAFDDRSMGLYAPRGGMADVPRGGRLPTGALRAAFDLLDVPHAASMARGAGGAWISALRLTVE